ncbi:MAG TPA: hypothetical protein ENN17_01520, partial [bacterium]|nr:hypothetical protein [bacterium]
FFDTFAKGRYRLGIGGVTEITHQTGTLDWYLFYGPAGEIIHEAYFDVIGKPKYVPLWACGPIFWRDQNDGGSREILEDIEKFTKLRIPLTACWVDRPYSRGAHAWSRMDFDENFERPEDWIRRINEEYGLEFMTWVAPATFQDRDFPGLLPGHFGYMDLTHPEALAEFERRLNVHQYPAGVRGHKMDRADEHFPLTARWHEPVTESESRNRYVYLFSKTIHGFLSRAHGKNQFNFARAAYHRCQPYLSAVWGGDSRSNWQGMAGSQANAVRCGFMGFPVWGQDTGGYLGPGRIDETLYIRWLQWGAWNGMFEIKIDGAGGSGKDRPPWKYSRRLQDVFRRVCETRMWLLPYIYSCANTSDRNGVLMKPLAYLYPEDPHTHTIWDQFVFGGAFLVSPMFTPGFSRTLYLPAGRWVDFDDPAREYRGPATLEHEVPLEKIPVFVRENSIYVTGDIHRGNSRVWLKESPGGEEITLLAFPGEPGDSTRFDYVDDLDGDRVKTMRLIRRPDRIVFRSGALTRASIVELRMDEHPAGVLLNGKSVKFDPDRKRKRISVRVGKDVPIHLEVICPIPKQGSGS